MIEKITKYLQQFKDQLSDWKINISKTEGREIYLIGNTVDMARVKNIENVRLTVYKDFKHQAKTCRGSASTIIHPTMNDSEMEETIQKAIYAAGFVKNEHFPIVNHVVCINYPGGSSTPLQELTEIMPRWIQEILEPSQEMNGVSINSAELFLNLKEETILNSKGLSVNFIQPSISIECITQAQGLQEEIELNDDIRLADLKEGILKSKIMQLLRYTHDRSKAVLLPKVDEVPVILSGDCVGDLLQYYLHRLSARFIHENISDTDIGENIQGDQVEGDLITLYLDPQLPGSYYSRPFDTDGFPLHRFRLIHQGAVERYWGDIQYSHYIHTAPTGQWCNISVESGSSTLQQMKAEPFLEITHFSDFQTDYITGDFGGEIRLGYYFDGSRLQPVYGGSIAGNLKKIHHQMTLSKEKRLLKKYYGPCSIKLKGVNVAGNI